MESIWQKNITKPDFPTLHGNIKTDVLIIGGGIAGILCGYMLKNSGADCVIVEAKTICNGVTKNTTAKITYQHGAIFDKMIRRFGIDTARQWVKAQSDAVSNFRELVKDIDCDFYNASAYVYSRNDLRKIEKELIALSKLGCEAHFTLNTELPFATVGAVEIPNQAQFDPLKFAYSISRDLKIFENTEVTEVTPFGALTRHGKIKASKIIVATHFPFIDKHGFYFLKMYQHRSYVLALKNAPRLKGMYIDECEKGLSFRSYNDHLLLGGGSHRTGKTGGGWRELRQFASTAYPKAVEVCHFAAQDCKTLDDIAYIGRYSSSTPNLYVATGFNKWGMTYAMVAASILCDAVQGKYNEFSNVFDPSRSMLRKQLFINAGESVLGLLTPTVPRCSHLGCALKYNKREHTWDCGCHGSRFTSDGRVIDNPAMRDIKIKHKNQTP